MLIRILYLLLFLIADFALYTRLNKTGWVSSRALSVFAFTFVGICAVHFFPIPHLIDWKHFLFATADFLMPLVTYLWFTFIVLKRVEKLKMNNEAFKAEGVSIASMFFMNVPYLIAIVLHTGVIFSSPLNP